jgi:hypothetical protein
VTHDVYVFGDSHWRVFFPFVNSGSPGRAFEHNGIRTVDMVANELSGATMHGLLNDHSKRGARQRVLHDLDTLGGVGIVGLVFGEVDVRYHNARYFRPDGRLDEVAIMGVLLRYKHFIERDLFDVGRVTGGVFVYYGFHYSLGPETLLQEGLPMGDAAFQRAAVLHQVIERKLPEVLCFTSNPIHVMLNSHAHSMVSDDGVHLLPEKTFPMIHARMKQVLDA